MSGNLNSSGAGRGNLYALITIATLTAIGLFATANYWTALQHFNSGITTTNITVNGSIINGTHSYAFTGSGAAIICTTNKTGCGSSSSATLGSNLTSTATTPLYVYKNNTGVGMKFRAIVCGSNMACSSNSTALRINSTATSGLSTITQQHITTATSTTVTSASFTNATGLVVTLPHRTGGYALIIFTISWHDNLAGAGAQFRIVDGATAVNTIEEDGQTSASDQEVVMQCISQLNGQKVQFQMASDGTHSVVIPAATNQDSYVTSYEIS